MASYNARFTFALRIPNPARSLVHCYFFSFLVFFAFSCLFLRLPLELTIQNRDRPTLPAPFHPTLS